MIKLLLHLLSQDVPDAVQSRKRAKREAILGPAVDKGVAHEDVGLKPAALVPKEVPMIKKKIPILQVCVLPLQVNLLTTKLFTYNTYPIGVHADKNCIQASKK